MTDADPDLMVKAMAVDFARAVVPFWQAALGAELIGVYLIGSLAHGGFSRRYSDIDIAVITEAGVSQQTLDGVRREAAALSPEWERMLSVFWADRHFGVGRFPPLDRIDYLDHAVAVMERERVLPARPTLDEIRHYLAGEPFANWTQQARTFASARNLQLKQSKPYLRALLYPARLCYSWMTGRMGSNDEAVAYLGKTRPAGLDVGLISRALECRQAGADSFILFDERATLLSQVDACAALVAETASSRT